MVIAEEHLTIIIRTTKAGPTIALLRLAQHKCCTAMRMCKLEPHVSTWVNVTNIIENKKSKSQMITYSVVPFIYLLFQDFIYLLI